MDNEPIPAFDQKAQNKRISFYSSNLVHRLFDRETGYDRNTSILHSRMPTSYQYELPMLKSFPPNFSIQNVDKPHGFMRKFTPNGRNLLSFSQDQRSLDIYEYRGVSAMADLLKSEEQESVTAADHSHSSLFIRQSIFQSIFRLKRSLRVAQSGFLNREFSIFVDNGRYVLIASMGMSNDLPPVGHIFEYPDICHETDLFFYNFYLVDLQGEFVSDVYSYKYDSIPLSHNHGVSVCGPTMAIYLKYRQCIDLFEIVDGKINKTYTIGPDGAYLRDPMDVLSSIENNGPDGAYLRDPMLSSIANNGLRYTMPLTHLKQRILAYIYRMYSDLEDTNVRRKKLREFYRDFPKYERMIISKMQLIGRENLLIRFEQHPSFSDRDVPNRTEAGYPFKLYVFYCITTQDILKVYFQNSSELLYLLRNHCDYFRNVRSLQTGRSPSSSSNNIHLLASFNETVSMITDPPERLNPTLPISTQSYSTSPYLDYNLFLYDDRQISALERPRISNMDSLHFRDRDTGKLLFRFYLEPTPDNLIGFNHTELIAFIFHPFEPFVISLQKLYQRYVVNFHIYNRATIVNNQ